MGAENKKEEKNLGARTGAVTAPQTSSLRQEKPFILSGGRVPLKKGEISMNAHLDEAYDIAAQIEAILFAIDETFMSSADSRLQNLHHTMYDLTERLLEALNDLAADKFVVDAIYAANEKKNCTLKTKE